MSFIFEQMEDGNSEKESVEKPPRFLGNPGMDLSLGKPSGRRTQEDWGPGGCGWIRMVVVVVDDDDGDSDEHYHYD